MKKLIFTTLILINVISIGYGQSFTGFNAAKTLIEFEGQRFLQYEVYDIDDTKTHSLTIQQTVKEVDGDEGFLFILSSYTFDNIIGVVITSATTTGNSYWNDDSQMGNKLFTNLHLLQEEFIRLNEVVTAINPKDLTPDTHYLTQFNQRITIDYSTDTYQTNLIIRLWIDKRTRHTFDLNKWNKVFKKHSKFIKDQMQ